MMIIMHHDLSVGIYIHVIEILTTILKLCSQTKHQVFYQSQKQEIVSVSEPTKEQHATSLAAATTAAI